jgi:hypothetical protein
MKAIEPMSCQLTKVVPAFIILLTTLLVLCEPLVAADAIWIEAERFDDCGGWVNDSQFIDQMGSPYLLANGMGEPVKDAVTHVEFSKVGAWRLWARTRDWVPEHHPGRFNLIINGKTVAREFGASGKSGWRWEDGGILELGGKVEVRLHDLTGYYGRCDALVFASDPNWIPADDKKALAAQRERFGGISHEVKQAGEYDVVVVGGGVGGCMAAVSAARMGARTVLIQNRPVLGGNGSMELLVPPVGVWPSTRDPYDPRETGLIEEIRTEGNQRTPETRYYSSRLKRLVTAEPNLALFLDTHVTGVEMKPGEANNIVAVQAVDTRDGRRLRFGGRIFIDCSGDGVVGVGAGASYCVGREPRSLYNEPLAPETGDNTTMGNSLKYASLPTGGKQLFATPPWVTKFDNCDSFPEGRHPPHLALEIGWQWKLELGGLQDTYRDKEEIRDELFKLVYGIWSHVKNGCPKLQSAAADHKLAWVPYVVGVRESRRLIGDHVFIEPDVAMQVLFPDRIAYGSWGLDDHYSEGFFHQGAASHHPYKGLIHSIPFRSLYSTNISNLMMAGRNISASHVGMGSTRVQLTCAVMGMAVGTAAGICLENNTSPRGVYQQHLEQLQQQLLKDGAYIVALPNRDPRDLARQALVTASSEGVDSKEERMYATNVINGYARAADGKANAWKADDDSAAPHWVELGWKEAKTFNLVHVTFFNKRLAPARFALEGWTDGQWRPLMAVDKQQHRHTLAVGHTTTSKLRLVLPVPAGVCEIRVYDEPERVVEIARRAWQNQGLPDGPDARLPWETNGVLVNLKIIKSEASKGIPLDDAVRKFGGVLLDDDRGKAAGEWVHSTYGQTYIGDGYLHDGNSGKGQKTLTFRPKLAKTGMYEVRLAYSALKNRASNTPITVRTASGTKSVRVNQRTEPEIGQQFHSLGQFELEAGETISITISNEGTDGYVVVDSIQLLLK